MSTAYNPTWLYSLAVIKEAKRWYKHHFITEQQFDVIKHEYPSSFYHPGFIIQILLFIATIFALSGITGMLALIISSSNSEEVWEVGSLFYGIVSFIVLEILFIKNNNHYKSGVTEALLYHSCGFTLGAFIIMTNENPHFWLIVSLIVLAFVAIRYLDLICTILAIATFAGLLFYELYELEGIFRAIIPFSFIVTFLPLYLIAKKLKAKTELKAWRNNLILVEAISLLLIYAGGNYLVVRELSVSMMDLSLEESQDTPFAIIFYILTAIIPIVYLLRGILKKDKLLIRISLLLVALSAFTFKYYFSFGHPEITLTIAGVIVLGITLMLLDYLKVMRNGYTRENILSEKWGDMNLEAFIISQTVGGNVNAPDHGDVGGGGQFGGGGSTDSF